MSLACVGSTHCVPAILGLPLHCSGSRLLYVERDLCCVWFQFSGSPQKCGRSWACVLCLPWLSSSGSQELDGRTLPGAVRLIPSKVPASVSARARVRWPVRCMQLVSVLRSWPLAVTLPADVYHPESQEVVG